MLVLGLLGAAGVTLSALFARYLPREIEIGPTVGGVLTEHRQPRPLLPGAARRGDAPLLAPSLVGAVAAVVAVGSQAYWVGCLARIRRLGRGRIA